MVKNYFLKITLFTVLALLCAIGLIITLISHQPTEIKSWLLYRLFIAMFLLVLFDVLFKQILKLKTTLLWIIQLSLLLIAVYIWVISE